ncbi:hypothetical protein ACN47E_009582 [Coniothyrium glycines]
MSILKMLQFLIVSMAAVASATPVEAEGMSLEPRANTWESHAKYYALGGKTGNEIYIGGTWSSPAKTVGQNSGPCSARIGGIGDSTIDDVNCSCSITGDGPLRFTSTCILDFTEQARNGGWTAGFSLAWECTAWSSCTGTNAYTVSSKNSECHNIGGTPCSGFRVTV